MVPLSTPAMHAAEMITHAKQAGKALEHFSGHLVTETGALADPTAARGRLRRAQRHIIKALEHLDAAAVAERAEKAETP